MLGRQVERVAGPLVIVIGIAAPSFSSLGAIFIAATRRIGGGSRTRAARAVAVETLTPLLAGSGLALLKLRRHRAIYSVTADGFA